MTRIAQRRTTPVLAATAALAVAATLLASAPAHGTDVQRARAPRTIIGVSNEANSVVYRIHPRSGRSTALGTAGIQLTDVAFRGSTLYGISFTALYTLDPKTGAAHVVGAMGPTTANALTVRPSNRTLLGADQFGDLFTIDRTTGAATLIGGFGHQLGSSGDLAFIGKHLFATVNKLGRTATLLARVNVRTGQATVIGKTGFHNVYGLIASKRRLYGGTVSGQMVSISKKTGHARLLSKTHLPIAGLTKSR